MYFMGSDRFFKRKISTLNLYFKEEILILVFNSFSQLKNKISLSYQFIPTLFISTLKSTNKIRRFIMTASFHLLCLMALFDPLSVYAQEPFRYTHRAYLGVMQEGGDEVELIETICSLLSEEDDILIVSFSLFSIDEGWSFVDGEEVLSANQDHILAPGECYRLKFKYSPRKTGKNFAAIRFECHLGSTSCDQGVTKSVDVVSKETFSRYRNNNELIPLGYIDLGERFSQIEFTNTGQILHLASPTKSQTLRLGSLFTDTILAQEEITELRLASCSTANGDRVDIGSGFLELKSSEGVSIRHLIAPYCTGRTQTGSYCFNDLCIVPDTCSGLDNYFVGGRLEYLHNGVSGTVCDDCFIDGNVCSFRNHGSMNVQVICRQLGLYSEEAALSTNCVPGGGAIWLDNLRCSGSESNIINCRHSGISIHNCGHVEDIGIGCNFFGFRPCLINNNRVYWYCDASTLSSLELSALTESSASPETVNGVASALDSSFPVAIDNNHFIVGNAQNMTIFNIDHHNMTVVRTYPNSLSEGVHIIAKQPGSNQLYMVLKTGAGAVARATIGDGQTLSDFKVFDQLATESANALAVSEEGVVMVLDNEGTRIRLFGEPVLTGSAQPVHSMKIVTAVLMNLLRMTLF